MQNNKKTDKVKAAQGTFRAHCHFIIHFWHMFIPFEDIGI